MPELLTGWGTAALALIALVAAVITIVQIRLGDKARHAETFSAVATRWNTEAFLNARRDILSCVDDAEKAGNASGTDEARQAEEARKARAARKAHRAEEALEAEDAKAARKSAEIRRAGEPRKAWKARKAAAAKEAWEAQKAKEAEKTEDAARLAAVLDDKMFELGATHNLQFWQLQTVLDFYEDLALLVEYGAISFKMVDSTLGTLVCEYWSYWKPWVYQDRDDDPGNYSAFESLAKRISKKHKYRRPWPFPDYEPIPPTKLERLAGRLGQWPDRLRTKPSARLAPAKR